MITLPKFFSVFLEHLKTGTNDKTFANVFSATGLTNFLNVLHGSSRPGQRAQANHASISKAAPQTRASLEETREQMEIQEEEDGVVADEDVGWRTASTAATAALMREDVKEIEFRRVDKFAEFQIAKNHEEHTTSRHKHTETEITTRTLAQETTKQVQAQSKAIEAEHNAKQAEHIAKQAEHNAKQAEHNAKQKEDELAMLRIRRRQWRRGAAAAVPSEEESDDDEESASEHEAPIRPRRRKKARRSAAPPQVRPRAGRSGITIDEYRPDVLLDYLRRAFGGEQYIWKTTIEQHFKTDQENPFMGFLPDKLNVQQTWLNAQLQELVREGLLRKSIYQGLQCFSFVSEY